MKEEDKPLEEVYFFWMERAMKIQRKAKNRLFKKMGINLTADQWMILKSLDEKEDQSQRELAVSVSKDPASITRSLDILENDGLIERRSADRRSFTVHLTKKGVDLVARVIPEAVKYRKKGIENITDAEMKTFRKVLNTMCENFSET